MLRQTIDNVTRLLAAGVLPVVIYQFLKGRMKSTITTILMLTLAALGSGCSENHSQTTSTQMGGAIQGKQLQLEQMVDTVAGVSPGSADGVGTAVRFNSPSGITTDGSHLFVVDRNNRKIRKIAIDNRAVTTLAGSGDSGDIVDGTGVVARFVNPNGITTDGTALYVLDASVVRKIVIATGEVTTIAGSATAQGSADGIGLAARFNNPLGITTDGTNLYISDTGNNLIRRMVIATAEVTTLAGTAGSFGSTDGIGMAARFGYLGGIATDGTNLFIADSSNCTVRKLVIATGTVTTLAGMANYAGSQDGTGSSARFTGPMGIAVSGTSLYVTESSNSTVRAIDLSTGIVSTLAGKALEPGASDGTGTDARFNGPAHVTVLGTDLYVADSANCTIRKIEMPTRVVSTLAGTATIGAIDGNGSAARFKFPNDITTDGRNLYVADTFNYVVRKIEIASGAVATIAGTALSYGNTDGIGAMARFGYLRGITTDGTHLFVTDYDHHTIRKIVIATGEVTTLAGAAGSANSTDGVGSAARFNSPYGITTDGKNLYVADSRNHTIRKIVIATGEVTTIAGLAGSSGLANGPAATARFKNPQGITTDGRYLYVTDLGNGLIRKMDLATGAISTLVETLVSNPATIGKSVAAVTVISPTPEQMPPPVPVPPTQPPAPIPATPSPPITAIPISTTTPIGVTTDGQYLYVTNPYRVRRVDIATGSAVYLAGTGSRGADNGPGATATFSILNGITTDGRSLYVTDNLNNVIRRIY